MCSSILLFRMFVLLWMDEILHHLRNPGMNKSFCNDQPTIVSTIVSKCWERISPIHPQHGRNPAPPQKPWKDDSPVNTQGTIVSTMALFGGAISGFRPSTVGPFSLQATHSIQIPQTCLSKVGSTVSSPRPPTTTVLPGLTFSRPRRAHVSTVMSHSSVPRNS